MKKILIPLLAIVGLASPLHANAQQVWSAELRAGANLPVDDLGDIELDPGFGFEGTVAYRFSPLLSAYAGWGMRQFDAETTNGSPDVEQTGYVFGLQAIRTLADSKLSYRARGGLTYEHIEIENARGDIVEDTSHGVGFEVGAAVVYSVSEQLSLTPGVRYRFLSRDVDFESTDRSVDLSYVVLDVGIAWTF